MGHTTRISDYESDRATTVGPEVEGYDVEAERTKAIEPEDKPEPKKSTAKTKAK